MDVRLHGKGLKVYWRIFVFLLLDRCHGSRVYIGDGATRLCQILLYKFTRINKWYRSCRLSRRICSRFANVISHRVAFFFLKRSSCFQEYHRENTKLCMVIDNLPKKRQHTLHVWTKPQAVIVWWYFFWLWREIQFFKFEQAHITCSWSTNKQTSRE